MYQSPSVRPRAARVYRAFVAAALVALPAALAAQEPAPLRTLNREAYSSNPPAFSPDGQRMAVPGNPTVAVWNIVSGTTAFTLLGHTRLVTVATFSPDGRLIATGSSDSTVRLWDATTGTPLSVLRGHQHEVTAVVFSRDGSRLASGSFDGAVMTWDVGQGRLLWARTEHRRAINDIVFMADGAFATVSGDGAFISWTATGGVQARAQAGGQGGGMAMLPDGRTVVHGTFDGNLLMRDAATASLSRTIQTGLQVFSVASSPDGRRLAIGSAGGVSLYDVATGMQVSRWAAHGTSAVMDVGYSPDGTVLATSASDRTVKLWPADTRAGATQTAAAPGAAIVPAAAAANALKSNVGTSSVSVSGGSVYLPAMGVSVTSPDATRWTASTQDLGNGRTADALIGQRDGWSPITFSVVRADAGTTCDQLMNNAASRDGARRVTNATHVPSTAGGQSVSTANGGSLFCIPTAQRALLFSVTPASYSSEQLLSVRLMALMVGTAGGATSSAGSGGTSSTAAAAGLTSSIYFSELGLSVGVLPGSGWTAGVATAASGTRMDQASRMGSDGNTIRVTMSRLSDAGTTCVNAMAAFTASDTHVESSPAWLASNWFSSVVVNPRGSFVCLPLANGVLIGSISRFSPTDNSQVRVLLIGLRLAAIDRWGAP